MKRKLLFKNCGPKKFLHKMHTQYTHITHIIINNGIIIMDVDLFMMIPKSREKRRKTIDKKTHIYIH